MLEAQRLLTKEVCANDFFPQFLRSQKRAGKERNGKKRASHAQPAPAVFCGVNLRGRVLKPRESFLCIRGVLLRKARNAI